MKRVKGLSVALAAILGLALHACAESVPARAPGACSGAPGEGEPGTWSRWLLGQEACRSDCCERPNWPGPLELFFRVGPSFLLGNSSLEQRLETGLGFEGGTRAFCYHQGGQEAWTGELAVGHAIYHSNDPAPLFVANRLYSLRVFQLTSVRIGGGHEWYWETWGPESWRGYTGCGGGARLGSANARFLNGPQITDVSKGLYLALEAGLLIPWGGAQMVLGTRLEWEHEWFEIDLNKESLDGVNLLFIAGVKF